MRRLQVPILTVRRGRPHRRLRLLRLLHQIPLGKIQRRRIHQRRLKSRRRIRPQTNPPNHRMPQKPQAHQTRKTPKLRQRRLLRRPAQHLKRTHRRPPQTKPSQQLRARKPRHPPGRRMLRPKLTSKRQTRLSNPLKRRGESSSEAQKSEAEATPDTGSDRRRKVDRDI